MGSVQSEAPRIHPAARLDVSTNIRRLAAPATRRSKHRPKGHRCGVGAPARFWARTPRSEPVQKSFTLCRTKLVGRCRQMVKHPHFTHSRVVSEIDFNSLDYNAKTPPLPRAAFEGRDYLKACGLVCPPKR